MCVLRSGTPLAPVLSERAVWDPQMGREVRIKRNREACWRCGRAEKLRRAVIAAFARGWSMARSLICRVRHKIFSKYLLERTCSVVVTRNWAWIRDDACVKSPRQAKQKYIAKIIRNVPVESRVNRRFLLATYHHAVCEKIPCILNFPLAFGGELRRICINCMSCDGQSSTCARSTAYVERNPHVSFANRAHVRLLKECDCLNECPCLSFLTAVQRS